MTLRLPLLFAALAAGLLARPAGGLPSGNLLLDTVALAEARQGRHPEAVDWLRRQATDLLGLRPPSVLDKTRVAASGDRHDYLSFGPYWWPDPSRPDGLPYVRRDGQVNPESREGTDFEAFGRVCRAIEFLGTAYAVTGEERFAAKAAVLARTWFLDPATRMHPNFQHAQAIPGITAGRGIGIIEAQGLMWANEGLALVAGSAAWTAADAAAMRAWNEAFYVWLTTSANGLAEKGEHNNHGSWYDAQVSHLAVVLGRADEARTLLMRTGPLRIARHVAADGTQPHEMSRTRSFDYALYNLEALLVCAAVGDRVGVDLRAYASPDGGSLGAALRFLAPFADPAVPWVKKDLSVSPRTRLAPLLRLYLRGTADPVLAAALAACGKDNAVVPWRPLYEMNRF